MANLLFKLVGVRGRSLAVYDTKCIIKTEVSAGSLLTSNATDGEKTIFYIDCAGIQFKESGLAIGYLQIETPSMQMNNQSSNFFSENTFTFEHGKNNVTNQLMREVYAFIADRVEGYKYATNTQPLTEVPEKIAALLPRKPAVGQIAASSSTVSEDWTCTKCGTVNLGRIQSCQGCGISKQWVLANRK